MLSVIEMDQGSVVAASNIVSQAAQSKDILPPPAKRTKHDASADEGGSDDISVSVSDHGI